MGVLRSALNMPKGLCMRPSQKSIMNPIMAATDARTVSVFACVFCTKNQSE